MEAEGPGFIVTIVVATAEPHPAVGVLVYVTVYVPGELRSGVIAPVELLINNPEGDEVNVPGEKFPVPVKVTV